MILVKIELVSAIHPSRSRELGRIKIVNDGSGTSNRGNYIAQLMRRGTTDKVLKTTVIQNYPRNAYSVWELVRRILQAILKGDFIEEPNVEKAERGWEVEP